MSRQIGVDPPRKSSRLAATISGNKRKSTSVPTMDNAATVPTTSNVENNISQTQFQSMIEAAMPTITQSIVKSLYDIGLLNNMQGNMNMETEATSVGRHNVTSLEPPNLNRPALPGSIEIPSVDLTIRQTDANDDLLASADLPKTDHTCHIGTDEIGHFRTAATEPTITSSPSSVANNLVMNSELKGKVALVTGSTSGIGLKIAENFARHGCHVILNGFADPESVKDIQSRLHSHNIKTVYFGDDLSTLKGNTDFCDKIIQTYPKGVDILVNNAGIQHVCPTESFPVQKWEQIIGVMLTSPFLLIQRFLPGMKDKGWGRIINIASVHGLVASPNKAAYVSAKHGILGLTKVVALETAGSGVTCNAICPGFVDTPIFQKQVETRSVEDKCSYDEASKRILQTVHPTLQPVGTDHVAKFVEFVCSEAASQMTGSCLTMDAGWTAR